MMSGEGTARIGLLMEPLDTLFFRDGRPFEPVFQARSGMPMPQTVAGAIRTWLLRRARCDFDRLGEKMRSGMSFAEAAREQGGATALVAQVLFRGPYFARVGERIDVLVPVPATLKKIEDSEEFVALKPLLDKELPGWRPPEEGMLPLWYSSAKVLEGLEHCYITLEGLKKFLCGRCDIASDLLESNEFLDFDHRVGILISPDTLTAAEGNIYSVGLLALKRGFVLYEELEGPQEVLKAFEADRPVDIPLGGEGRRVAVRKVEPVVWPSAEASDGAGTFIVLTTPGIFDDGWRPSFLKGNLEAAAVPGYEAVSGWDLARGGPKPTRFAVRAGSVYFLKKPLDKQCRSLCAGEDAALGWGAFVEGAWNRGGES